MWIRSHNGLTVPNLELIDRRLHGRREASPPEPSRVRSGRGDRKEPRPCPPSSPLSAVEQLLAIEEIKRVQYKYAYSADHHNWDDFASVFAAGRVIQRHDFPIARKPGTNEPVSSATSAYLEAKASGTEWPVIGRDAIRAQVANTRADHTMVHHLFNPEVDLTSDTTATAVFRFESHHWLRRASRWYHAQLRWLPRDVRPS